MQAFATWRWQHFLESEGLVFDTTSLYTNGTAVQHFVNECAMIFKRDVRVALSFAVFIIVI